LPGRRPACKRSQHERGMRRLGADQPRAPCVLEAPSVRYRHGAQTVRPIRLGRRPRRVQRV